MSADIRVWVLTGDKQETAIEIGKSCSLIKPSMELIDLSSDCLADLDWKITHMVEKFAINKTDDFDELNKIKSKLFK